MISRAEKAKLASHTREPSHALVVPIQVTQLPPLPPPYSRKIQYKPGDE